MGENFYKFMFKMDKVFTYHLKMDVEICPFSSFKFDIDYTLLRSFWMVFHCSMPNDGSKT